MRSIIVFVAFVFSITFLPAFLSAQVPLKENRGEALFQKNCSPCHKDGGNLLNREKTLSKKDREANNIRTAEDIVKKMRNPGAFPTHPQTWSGMKIFDQKAIADDDALKIADYIIETFK